MSKIQVNEIVNHFDTGAPDCPKGLTVTGFSTFSGGVSIGGTLTYEDVTNIDSVGLSTFQNGIHVTGGSVGVGTNNPSRKIHINSGSTDTAMLIESTDADVQINLKDVDSSDGISIGCDQDDFYVRTGLTTERLRIDSTGRLLKSGQASLTSTTLSYPIQVAAASDANAIAIFGRAADDIGELGFYEADKTTKLGELQYRQDHLNLRCRVGDIRFASGGTSETLRIDGSGRIAQGGKTPTNHGSPNLLIWGSDPTVHLSSTGSTANTSFTGIKFAVAGGSTGDYSKAGIFVQRQDSYNDLDMIFAFRSTNDADGVAISDEKLRIDSNGRLLAGHTSSLQNQTAQIVTNNGSALGLYKFANNDDGAELTFFTSRNATKGSHTVVNNGDYLGRMFFRGSDGDEYHRGAELAIRVDGTPGDDDMPGRFEFMTTPDGSTSPTTRLTIKASGAILAPDIFDSTTSGSANVIVSSDGRLRNNASSRRFKTDIETLEDSYADNLLENIRPVWFRSKCEGDNPSHGYYGFIAEEVHEIDPRLVIYQETKTVVQEDGSLEHVAIDPIPHAVAYPHFVSPLFNLVKRQKAQIEALEARLTALEGN
jgi:hypothetical protein